MFLIYSFIVFLPSFTSLHVKHMNPMHAGQSRMWLGDHVSVRAQLFPSHVSVLPLLTGQTLICSCQTGSFPTNQFSSFYLHLPPPGRWKLNVAVILRQLGAL